MSRTGLIIVGYRRREYAAMHMSEPQTTVKSSEKLEDGKL